MTRVTIENPIINSPFAEPTRHFVTSPDGEITGERFRETPAEIVRRVTRVFGNAKNIVVLNDDAHHCYAPTPKDKEGALDADERQLARSLVSMADTASRQRGDDLVASRRGARLIAEVKGYPSTGYRDPRRANEVKRTNPSVQAKQWFAEALLRVIRTRAREPRALHAIAFPAFQRYLDLIDECEEALKHLSRRVYLVDASAAVTVRVAGWPEPGP